MKKLLFSLKALLISSLLFAQVSETQAQKKADEIAKIKTETIDLGKIKQDNPTPAVFEVLNIGNEDLIIEQANPTCGCTISDYTKDKIAPGKTGTIKATYNAKNIGMFEKHLTVKFAGCDDMKSITIKGEVIKNEDAAATATPAPASATIAAPAVDAAAVKTETKAPAKASSKISAAPKKVATKKAAPAPAKP